MTVKEALLIIADNAEGTGRQFERSATRLLQTAANTSAAIAREQRTALAYYAAARKIREVAEREAS